MVLTPERIQQIREEIVSLPPEEQQAKIEEILSTLTPDEVQQLQGGSQCPFCLMVEGKIQTTKIFEDDTVLAILDINPANKGHTLVFPKKHYALLTEMDDKETEHIFKIANKLLKAISDALGAQGGNIFVANGPVAGQSAPHVLINLIPRFDKDGVRFGWPPKKLSEEEFKDAASKIGEKVKEVKFKEEKVEVKKKIVGKWVEEYRIP